MDEPLSVSQRLRRARVSLSADPVTAWRELRRREGAGATVMDLYELVANQRGLSARDLPLDERTALARSVMPDVWPGFELTGESQRVGDLIRIVDHDPQWSERYELWHQRLRAALGPTALRIEHVGSTSVSGLPAKPIVDIQVSVADLDDESRYVPHIEQVGVQLRSRDDLHRYFRAYPGRPREIHVHVCPAGSDWESEHLLFRDYLRDSAEARTAYAAVKRAAADAWADDGIAYTDAKNDIIGRLLDAARQWRASTPRALAEDSTRLTEVSGCGHPPAEGSL